jgi:hypothetical protein
MNQEHPIHAKPWFLNVINRSPFVPTTLTTGRVLRTHCVMNKRSMRFSTILANRSRSTTMRCHLSQWHGGVIACNSIESVILSHALRQLTRPVGAGNFYDPSAIQRRQTFRRVTFGGDTKRLILNRSKGQRPLRFDDNRFAAAATDSVGT